MFDIRVNRDTNGKRELNLPPSLNLDNELPHQKLNTNKSMTLIS